VKNLHNLSAHVQILRSPLAQTTHRSHFHQSGSASKYDIRKEDKQILKALQKLKNLMTANLGEICKL